VAEGHRRPAVVAEVVPRDRQPTRREREALPPPARPRGPHEGIFALHGSTLPRDELAAAVGAGGGHLVAAARAEGALVAADPGGIAGPEPRLAPLALVPHLQHASDGSGDPAGPPRASLGRVSRPKPSGPRCTNGSTTTRGNGFHLRQPEGISSECGTHRLGRQEAEPIASCGWCHRCGSCDADGGRRIVAPLSSPYAADTALASSPQGPIDAGSRAHSMPAK
jgi:hypothetical protein